jgi:transcriptional regulator EpsA
MEPECVRKFCCFIDRCNNVENVHDLKDVICAELRQVLPHQMAVCGIAQLSPTRIIRLINVDFPAAYLQKVIRPDQTIISPLFTSWTSTQAPSITRIEKTTDSSPGLYGRSEREHKIENVASYGVVDGSAVTFSYFVFGNVYASVSTDYRELLLATVPHLHVSLVRVLTRNYLRGVQDHVYQNPRVNILAKCDEIDSLRLTEREKQILQFICGGKSNKEIGDLLRISEFTVKTHVKNLLAKLCVTSRTEAVAKAMNAHLFGRHHSPVIASA